LRKALIDARGPKGEKRPADVIGNAEKPAGQIIDLAERCGNIVTLEIAPRSIPARVAAAPTDRARERWCRLFVAS
jgi:hypothetical protein